MNARIAKLPPPTVIDPALRKITETLTAAIAGSHTTTPDWSDLEWNLAKAVSAMHGISSLLCRSVSWQGREGWGDFLEDQHAHTAIRHRKIIHLLRCIDDKARADGVTILALKGAALHGLGLYEIGERPMADVDLLVRPQEAERAAGMLESLGYRESGPRTPERTFIPVAALQSAPLGEHWHNPIKIDFHERIAKTLPHRVTDISDSIFPPHPLPGVTPYPSLAALLLHLLLHAAAAMAPRTLRVVHLHDLAVLVPRMNAADWEEFLEFRSAGPLWWASPPLELMLRYYASPVPLRVREALRSDCPGHLLRLHRNRLVSDVSFSYLWVEAFPGIGWARTFTEIIEYALCRIRPSAQVMTMRRAIAMTERWGADPQWSQLSQTRRILAWLTSRPARPVTMDVVRAVLGAG
jgi:Uncharacterised nucleotidyltransferase